MTDDNYSRAWHPFGKQDIEYINSIPDDKIWRGIDEYRLTLTVIMDFVNVEFKGCAFKKGDTYLEHSVKCKLSNTVLGTTKWISFRANWDDEFNKIGTIIGCSYKSKSEMVIHVRVQLKKPPGYLLYEVEEVGYGEIKTVPLSSIYKSSKLASFYNGV